VDELDPAVLEAFDALAAAAEEYDELLYTVHDEVTPFEVPAEPAAAYSGPSGSRRSRCSSGATT